MRGVTGKEAVQAAYQAPIGTVIDEEASKKFRIKVRSRGAARREVLPSDRRCRAGSVAR